MEHIKRYFWLYLLALSGLWWLTDPPALATLTGLRPWRDVLMQVTGVLGIGVMSAGMVLALRPKWFEPRLGGLDKMYRLHKWLGIAGLVLAISHWVVAQGPKWLSGLGLIAPRVRGPRPEGADAAVSFLQSQRGLAEGIGEWAFYAAVLLIVLALVKRFPYRRFFQTHKLLAVAYLALVFHSVVLLKPADWTGPLGPVLALLMAAGSVGAVLVLTGRLAARRRVVGEVLAVRHHTTAERARGRRGVHRPVAGPCGGAVRVRHAARGRRRAPRTRFLPRGRAMAASPSSSRRWATTPARSPSV